MDGFFYAIDNPDFRAAFGISLQDDASTPQPDEEGGSHDDSDAQSPDPSET
jgi:hypothetical protein